MLVWRVEHKRNNNGPYSGARSYKLTEMSRTHSSYKRKCSRPSPYGDGLKGFSWGHCCAMTSEKSLKWWFEGYLKELAREGFVIRVYDVNRDDTTTVGQTGQVGFIRDKAQIVDEYSCVKCKYRKKTQRHLKRN